MQCPDRIMRGTRGSLYAAHSARQIEASVSLERWATNTLELNPKRTSRAFRSRRGSGRGRGWDWGRSEAHTHSAGDRHQLKAEHRRSSGLLQPSDEEAGRMPAPAVGRRRMGAAQRLQIGHGCGGAGATITLLSIRKGDESERQQSETELCNAEGSSGAQHSTAQT